MNIYVSVSFCLLFTLSMQAMEKHKLPAPQELRPITLKQHPHHTTDDLSSTAPYQPLLDPSDDLRATEEARKLGDQAFPREMFLMRLLASCCPTFFSPDPFQ